MKMEELEINKILKVILQVDELMNTHIYSFYSILSSAHLKGILIRFEELKKSQTNPGFNIFHLISDTYYKENFHSDIIAAFLDTNGKHNAGNEYLNKFIQLLNKKLSTEHKIDINDFTNTNKSITREKHRIDILIKDEKTNKAIIIENKINNAGDTERQLPKYVDAVIKNEGVEKDNIVAIVYLPLEKNKEPNKEDWTEEEKKFIETKFIKIVAYDESEEDLLNGWLKPCINITNDIDSLSILRQYSKLIQNIGGNIMNKKLFEDFYSNIIIKNDNYKTALSIKSMVEELPQYLAQRIVDEFSNDPSPFNKIWRNNTATGFGDGKINEYNFTIIIHCFLDKYTFSFYDENYQVNGLKYTEKIIKYVGSIGFYIGDNELDKDFKFPDDEKQLYEFIKESKGKLKTLPKGIFE